MDSKTSDALRELFEEDAGARRFFQWAAERQNDAAQTSIERLGRKAGVDRRKAIEFARQLEDLGCGRFVIGRRGALSRIEWAVSLKSIGRAAAGESATLETVDPELVADTVDFTEAKVDFTETKKEEFAATDSMPLSIAEAKRRLAASLGIPAEAIEITIRA